MSPRDLGRLALIPFAVGAFWAPPASASTSADICVIDDPAIVESSGLVVTDRWFVTVNDSGDGGRLFLVDKETCETVGVTSWDGDPFDVEAIAPAGPDAVWVGDIGDNREIREDITVFRVPLAEGDHEVEVEPHTLRYPDGAHNAESLLTEPDTGRIVVITKDVLGGTAYTGPRSLSSQTVTLTQVGGGLLPVATDAAFFPDGEHIVVRNYRRAVVYTWPGLETVGDFVLPNQPQGEGIAVVGDRLFLTSEGTRQPVIEVDLPAEVRRAMGLPEEPGSPTTTPGSGEDEAAEEDSEELTTWLVVGGVAVAAAGIGALWVRRRSRRRG